LNTFINIIPPLLLSTPGWIGLFQWLDSRNREIKERRYSKYIELINTVSGTRPDGNTPNVTEQIAAVWLLPEYKEYKQLTYKIFSCCDLIDTTEDPNGPWVQFVLPQIHLLIKEISS